MLIRRPVADVFEAFIDPAITSSFWFTKGSARLDVGKTVEWTWATYGLSIPVTAKAIERDQRILIEWPGYGSATTVQWTFAPFGDDATFVSITESGFVGDGDQVLKAVASSSEGFTLVLAGAKAYLEQGVRLNLIADRYPKGLATGG
ncbi:MAG TPA: SRPBCC family protein [Gemmatimonadaceae bacterium]|nr:SRPBCC family protein [Gemmatimonadaceae bacterium]